MSARVTRRGPARFLNSSIAAVLGTAVLLTGCSKDEEPVIGAGPSSSADTSPSPTPAAETAETAKAEEADPRVVLTRISEQIDQAKSVRVKAKVEMGGEKYEFDVRMNRAGRAKGKIATGADGSVDVILIGQKGWMKPGPDMLADITGGDPAVEEYMAGKWIPFGPDNAELGQFVEIMKIDAFFEGMITEEDLTGDKIVRVKGKKIGGRETFGLKKKGEPGTMFVAADGSNEMVAFRDPDGGMQFSDWNKAFKVKKPAKVFTQEELS